MLILQIQFFKHLLSRTKAGILNLDISFRLEPRKQNQILGQIRDPDGRAHFKDEYFSALADAHRNKLCAAFHLQRADQQLCCALRNAHHAGRPNRLVRGDHDEIFDAKLSRHAGNVPGAEYVSFYGGEDVLFHQRNMLVGGCMIQNRRVMMLYHPFSSASAGDTADLRVKTYVWEASSHLSVKMEEGSLCLIETHNGKRAEVRSE